MQVVNSRLMEKEPRCFIVSYASEVTCSRCWFSPVQVDLAVPNVTYQCHRVDLGLIHKRQIS